VPDLQQPDARVGGGRATGTVHGYGVLTAAARQRGHHVRARGPPVRVVDPKFFVVEPYGYPLGSHLLRNERQTFKKMTGKPLTRPPAAAARSLFRFVCFCVRSELNACPPPVISRVAIRIISNVKTRVLIRFCINRQTIQSVRTERKH